MFAVLNFCNTHNSGNTVLTIVWLHINGKAHAACDLNFIVNGKGLLQLTGSHGQVVIFRKWS